MACINREYDDLDIMTKIPAIRPDISFGEDTRIVDIDVEPASLGARYRDIKVELLVSLRADEFADVFAKPVA